MAEWLQKDYSISTLTWIGLPLTEALNRLTASGWRHIEIMVEDGHRELLDWSETQRTELERWSREEGISWSVHAPIHGVNACASDPETIEAGLATLKQAIGIAHRLDAAYVVLHPGEYKRAIPDVATDPDGYAAARADCLSLCALFLRRLINETGGEAGIPLALENVPPRPDRFGSDCGFLLEAIAAAGTSRVRILLDAGHAHLCGPGRAIAELRKCKPLLIGMHIGDNHGERDEHLAVGSGTVPYRELAAELGEDGERLIWVLETGNEAAAAASLNPLEAWRAPHRAARGDSLPEHEPGGGGA
ncbi:sugar phosphate isomerase/epimerase family protein [Paenibacillus sp. FSL H7-0716]|uniref:Xylose isomerase-like TIM barrel domain-containing protein n=1 Tax=Paenibacillus odorifer TaxID=189426 RepID=A0A1R0Y833_9BACL|nr:sugar phosphate isomerase/epimerase family protein [Paenibacillus odorifer]OMD43499.1 hypothetical protein BSK52_03560 [Paenibacillus odorifer]OME16615.1 hypothetical protein BSK47_20380 [Paenibacillus odorifer]